MKKIKIIDINPKPRLWVGEILRLIKPLLSLNINEFYSVIDVYRDDSFKIKKLDGNFVIVSKKDQSYFQLVSIYPNYQLYSRVGVLLSDSLDLKEIKFFGYGKYIGDIPLGYMNEDGSYSYFNTPKIELDNGKYIYGTECLWDIEVNIKKRIDFCNSQGWNYFDVDIDDIRNELNVDIYEATIPYISKKYINYVLDIYPSSHIDLERLVKCYGGDVNDYRFVLLRTKRGYVLKDSIRGSIQTEEVWDINFFKREDVEYFREIGKKLNKIRKNS